MNLFFRARPAVLSVFVVAMVFGAGTRQTLAQKLTLVPSSIYTHVIEFKSIDGDDLVGVRILVEWKHVPGAGGYYSAHGWGPQENAPRDWSLIPPQQSIPPTLYFPAYSPADNGNLIYALSEGTAHANDDEKVAELVNRINSWYRANSYSWQVYAHENERTFDTWVTFDKDTVAVGESVQATVVVSNYYGTGDITNVRPDSLVFATSDGGAVNVVSGPTPASVGSLPFTTHTEFAFELEGDVPGTIVAESMARGFYRAFGPTDSLVATSLCGKYETTPCTLVIVPGGLIVNETSDEPDLDPGDGVCDTNASLDGPQCTLRAAIQEGNAQESEETIRIRFDIERPGVPRIALESSLPEVVKPAEIGEAGAMVNVDGQGSVPVALHLVAPNSTVQGLAFDGFEDGVIVQGGGATIRSSVFGRFWLDTSSDASQGIQNAAIHVLNVANVQIGGADATPGSLVGNVIVNSGTGVLVERSNDVRIQGNRIGTVERPIRGSGISAVDVVGLQIGGPRSLDSMPEGYRNDVEGARGHGIEISGASDDLTIQGNEVEASHLDGIRIDLSAATKVLIGGAEENLRNEVSWNHEAGIHLSGGSDRTGASGVIVAGNYTHQNGSGGILLSQVGNVLVGGASSEPGVAPGNTVTDGLVVRFASGARIQGNELYSRSGPDDMPGLSIGGTDVLVGGEADGEGNKIFGFGTADFADDRPVALLDEGSDTIIQGNVITGALTGVLLQGYRHKLLDNVISGNAGNGVRVASLGGERVEIQGNLIGVAADGMTADPNGAAGILVQASNVHIGGEKMGEACEGPCNVIAGMRNEAGIWIAGEDVTVRGNMIGVGADGSTPVPNAWGIVVDADDATIGGTSAAEDGVCDLECNVISGNTLHGIRSSSVSGDGVDLMIVSGNYIGKTLTGYAGNGLDGISVGGGTMSIIGAVVGGAVGSTGNVIAHNGGTGVSACGTRWHPLGPEQLTVRANQIYENGRMPAFDLSRECSAGGASDGITMNDQDDADDGPNGLLNTPTLVASRPADGGRSLLVLWTGDRDQSPSTYQVDVYANAQCRGYSADGSLRVANRTFTFPLSSASDFDTLAITVPFEPADLRHYTATFTDADGNTSEFGNCISGVSDPEVTVLKLAAGVEVQAPGLLAKLKQTTGKRPSADEVAVIASFIPSSGGGDEFEETIARAPDGSYVQPRSTTGGTWQFVAANAAPAPHDVCLDASGLEEGAIDQTVVVTRSPHTGGHWSPVDTYTRTVGGATYACADGIPVFGHYALGSGSAAEAMPPQLFTPEAGITINSTTPDLEWESVGGALRYDVQVALDRAFASVLRDTMGIGSTTWRVSDQLPTGATLYWRARAVLDAGPTPWSSAFTFKTDPMAVFAEGAGPLPEAFGLTSIYPNPSSGGAYVQFALPEPAHVAIEVYDVLGRRVGVVVDGSLPAGTHQARFEGQALSSGLYLVRMQGGSFVETRTLTVVR